MPGVALPAFRVASLLKAKLIGIALQKVGNPQPDQQNNRQQNAYRYVKLLMAL